MGGAEKQINSRRVRSAAGTKGGRPLHSSECQDEEKVIQLRFGIGCEREHTLEEIVTVSLKKVSSAVDSETTFPDVVILGAEPASQCLFPSPEALVSWCRP